MKIEINTATETLRSAHLTELLHEFIQKKISMVLEHHDTHTLCDEASVTVWNKYCATLWMVGCKLGMLNEHEVAQHADIPLALLRDWQQQRYFNALMAEHYREFLELVITVLT